MPLAELAARLQAASPADRRLFAALALEETAASYAREAQAAALDEDAPDERRRALARWRAATLAYARDLERLRAALAEDSAVEVYVEADRNVRLRIDGRQVMVAGPRPGDPEALGARLAARYCALADCGHAASSPAAPAAQPPPRATWSFSERRPGPVLETTTGLRFAFASTAELQRKKALCLALAEELGRLARELARHRDRGLLIEWSQLRIADHHASGEQRVIVNQYGHALRLPLPTLARVPAALAALEPWLAAEVERRSVEVPPIEAERLLAGMFSD